MGCLAITQRDGRL